MSATHSTVLTSGIVLAGTFPWANSAFDRLSPRPLVPVAQRPLIAFSLSWLQSAGIRSVIVCGNRNSRALQANVMQQFAQDLHATYIEDLMPRGAAGCVRDAVMSSTSQTFVVTDGACVPDVNLVDLLSAHAESGAAATVVVHQQPRRPGQVALSVPAGVYVFDRRVLPSIAARGFVDIKEHLIPELVRAGERVATFVVTSVMPRVLNAETYLAVNEFATQLLVAGWAAPDGYNLHGESLIHRDASVSPDVTLVGPVMVGAGATIESGAVIVGPTSIGLDVTIGAGALVSRSSLWRRSHVLSKAVVDRSIVADDGVVGPGQRAYRAIVPGTPRRNAYASLRRDPAEVNVAGPAEGPARASSWRRLSWVR